MTRCLPRPGGSSARRSGWVRAGIVGIAYAIGAAGGVAEAQPVPGEQPTVQPGNRPEKAATPTTVPRPPAGQREADRRRAEELGNQSLRALLDRDYPRAEALLREQLLLQPSSFVTLYNLASIRALQDDVDGAIEFLKRSIENGFCDLRQLERDPHLELVRGNAFFATLRERWGQILDARLEANLKQAGEIFKGGYTVNRDERLRVAYFTGVDARAAEVARAELTMLAEWADREVFPGILNPEESVLDPHVLIIVPNRRDFTRWAVTMFGAAANTGIAAVGGSYEHDLKRLVTQDLGSSLRHEFFHVLHWRSCGRLGQSHPIWIQEGLCSLVEDYDPDANGNPRPAPSWRTNTVKRMDRSRTLLTVEQLVNKSHAEFNGSRRLGLYAHARAVFLYLSDQGLLRAWYQAYTEGYETDRTGLAALEKVLGKPAREIDADFKAWVRGLPTVPEESHPGMASLGITVDAGDGEGPVVEGVPLPSVRRVELIPGDVITSIDDRSVRDLPELLRLLGGREPGDVVRIGYRRGERYGEVEMTLVRAGP